MRRNGMALILTLKEKVGKVNMESLKFKT
jgi:hypothetical protein